MGCDEDSLSCTFFMTGENLLMRHGDAILISGEQPVLYEISPIN